MGDPGNGITGWKRASALGRRAGKGKMCKGRIQDGGSRVQCTLESGGRSRGLRPRPRLGTQQQD